jgi:hypothetical protein
MSSLATKRPKRLVMPFIVKTGRTPAPVFKATSLSG